MDCVRARFELLRLTPHLQCSLQGIRITHQGFQMFYGAGNELQAIGENHRLNLANRIMHRHQLCAIRKGCFYLHFMNHFRHPFHHVFAFQQGCAIAH